MMARFTGNDGRPKLIEALLRHDTVAGDASLADRIAAAGQLVQFEAGETICEQGRADDDVFFIINGAVNVFVNHQHIGTRESGTVVGEMAAVDPSAVRSATLKAADQLVTLKMSATEFLRAGGDSGPFWRRLAQLGFDRLRMRARFHLPANPTPIMFVGSSVEGLSVAQELPGCLQHDKVIVRPWTTKGVFGPSGIPIDELISRVEEADFALFVFGPDDKIQSRGKDYSAPRDNVIFEMGLFMGRLGRERVFMVKDANVDLKIPSDLTGVTPITYSSHSGTTEADIAGIVCAELRKAIQSKGAVANRMRMVP
ncbi:MAG: nucleotide-binding protein [Planctomycetes bacterium]|nr:nucleotide-binding protein [Planctomycetota bacterium]